MYLLTYLLTQFSSVFLEMLTGSQLVKKFPHFMKPEGSLPLLQVTSTSSHFLKIHLILSLSVRQDLPSGLFALDFPTKTVYPPLLSPISATSPAHHILLDFITRIIFGEGYKSLISSLCSFLHSPATSSLLDPNILLNTLFLNTLILRSSLIVSDQV